MIYYDVDVTTIDVDGAQYVLLEDFTKLREKYEQVASNMSGISQMFMQYANTVLELVEDL